jgi:hypothetical protein
MAVVQGTRKCVCVCVSVVPGGKMVRDYYKEMGGGGDMKYKREIRSLWEGNKNVWGDR